MEEKFIITINNGAGCVLFKSDPVKAKNANQALFRILEDERIELDDGDTIEIEVEY